MAWVANEVMPRGLKRRSSTNGFLYTRTGHLNNMRELLELRSNLENRSNHKPVQPHVCEEILFLI